MAKQNNAQVEAQVAQVEATKGEAVAAKGEANAGKTDRLNVVLGASEIVVNAQYKDGENWVTRDSRTFAIEPLPADMKKQVLAYGLSKLLQDRTSQFRSLGPIETLKAMDGYYDMLKSGQWAAKRAAGVAKGPAFDPVLAAVIATEMGVSLAAVSAKLGQLPKEALDKLVAKYEDQVAKAKAEAEEVEFSF